MIKYFKSFGHKALKRFVACSFENKAMSVYINENYMHWMQSHSFSKEV